MKMQVRSLALLSVLRLWHCHELWCRSQTCLGSVGNYSNSGSGHQCQKVRHMDKEKSRQGSLLLQMGGGTPKSACTEQRTLPYLSLMQVIYLSPSHWPGQGAHSSPLANLKHIVNGRRGKGVGHRKAKLEQNGVTKISFDRKDIMLLSTPPNKNL